MYIILHLNKRKYVNKSGSKNTFTKSIIAARKYRTKKTANADCCGDKHVIKLTDIPGLLISILDKY